MYVRLTSGKKYTNAIFNSCLQKYMHNIYFWQRAMFISIRMKYFIDNVRKHICYP